MNGPKVYITKATVSYYITSILVSYRAYICSGRHHLCAHQISPNRHISTYKCYVIKNYQLFIIKQQTAWCNLLYQSVQYTMCTGIHLLQVHKSTQIYTDLLTICYRMHTFTLRNEPLCPGLFSCPSSRPFLGTGKLRASYGFVPSATVKQKTSAYYNNAALKKFLQPNPMAHYRMVSQVLFTLCKKATLPIPLNIIYLFE